MRGLWQTIESIRSTTSMNNKRISCIILINLVLAFVSLCKDSLLAWYLGTSAQADAFLLAYFITDTIGNNLLANALGVAVIPVLAGLYGSRDNRKLTGLTQLLIVYTVIISTLMALLMFVLRVGLLSWVGAGLGSSRELSLGLFTLLIPSLIVFPLINIGISIMQVHNRYNIPALAPVLFNLIYLLGLLYLLYAKVPLVIGVHVLSIFIMIGLLVMLMMVWIPIFNGGLISLPTWTSILRLISRNQLGGILKEKILTVSSDLIRVWKSFLQYLMTLLFPQIIFFVERNLASHLETGSISGLNYAFRIVHFPLWVFIAAVSAVLFPVMAKLSASENEQEYNLLLTNSIYYTAVFTIPFTVIFFVLRVPIISILLQRGEFSANSLAITANIMAGYSLTLIWQGFSVIWIRAALVKGKVYYALLFAAVSAGLTIGLDLILVPIMGAGALGYGAAIGAIINSLMLYWLFCRQIQISKLWKGLSKIIMANLPLLLVAILLSKLWASIAELNTFATKICYALVVVIACLSACWIGFKAFNIKLSSWMKQ